MKNIAETKIALKRNIKDLLRIEYYSNTIEDVDFGIIHSGYGWKEEDFIEYVRKKNTSIHICQISNTIIGYIAFFKEKDILYIDKLVIDPLLRKNGFGTILLDFVKSLDFLKILCYVDEHDDTSIMFFKRKRFSSKLISNHFGKGKDAICFERNKNEKKTSE